ncbi:ArdC-like ssDNA-binding domain-containing protein, partial [Enterococcus faecium]|uniref:ArdC-like ssDNA-binding domain-containing protein n=1 Tax=Enterococcus faecium TaxID=1352 RepID=UPI001D03BE67
EIKQEVKSLSQQALDAVKKHTHSPEDVKELLNFMSRFPERSFRNQLLIEEQFPGATACLGRAALKKEGIYIKKGNKGTRSLSEKRSKDFMRKDVALFEKQKLHQKIKNESKVVKSK